MKIAIVTKTGERLGVADTESGPLVGQVVGPVTRGWEPGKEPDPLQPSTLSVSGLTLDEVLKLQGESVVIFRLREG